jgi:hypothetical protein
MERRGYLYNGMVRRERIGAGVGTYDGYKTLG